MSMFVYSYSYIEDTPTLDGVNDDISNIVGLSEIKSQLNAIVKKILAAERCASLGLRVVPPKPFHMFFLGNSGTGKSTVARIIGKLFYLAGVLPSYHVIEMRGSKQSIEDANGGILLVDVGEHELDREALEGIVSAMDGGETAVIFAGQYKRINRCMLSNKEIYKRFSVTLHFNDLTCEELARILEAKMKNQAEDDAMRGLKLHPSCCVDMIGKLISEQTSEKLREDMNAFLLDPMLLAAKNNLEGRIHFEAGTNDHDRSTVTMQDLKAGIFYTNGVFK